MSSLEHAVVVDAVVRRLFFPGIYKFSIRSRNLIEQSIENYSNILRSQDTQEYQEILLVYIPRLNSPTDI